MKAAERADDRRQQFLQAGIETFGVQGYARTGIRDVCRAAGLTERYFYESFQSKEDLLRDVYRMIVEEQKSVFLEILIRMDIPPREKAARGIRLFYEKLREDPRRARIQFFEVLGVSSGIDGEYLSALDMMSGMTAALTGAVFPDMKMEGPSEWIIPTGISGSMIHIAMKWILNGYDVPLDKLVERVTEIMLVSGESLQRSVVKSGTPDRRKRHT
jgi:AcrR family transcriptional regulator